MYIKRNYKGEGKMKVFISWSGDVSFQVAKILKEWIPCIIQEAQPYFSSEDIDKGARWSTDIAKELETASFGILCVTKDNLQSQWLNFEAGALSKAIDKSKVCPLLFHLKPSDISNSPILQFQMANVEKQDVFKLFKSINNSLGDAGLDEGRLEKIFDAFWPQMEDAFKRIEEPAVDSKKSPAKNEANNTKILEEMLELLRNQQMILKSPEKIFPAEYVQDIMRQAQKDTEKQTREMLPRRALIELRENEMYLSNIIVEQLEADSGKQDIVRVATKRYMSSVQRVLRLLGIDHLGYRFYRDEE